MEVAKFNKPSNPVKRLERRRRVVITGIGAISPGGIGKDAFWKVIAEGRSTVDRISFFDPSAFPSQVAAEARCFKPQDFMPAKNIKRTGRAAQLAVAAAQLALSDSGLSMDRENSHQIGIVLGSSVGGMDFAELEFRNLFDKGVKAVSPYAGIAVFCASISSEVSMALGLKGPSWTISTGCTSSTDAMGCAFNAIRYGMANVIITGGADACVTPGVLAAFCQMGALSTGFNQDPQRASRPFNLDRDGFVLSEGAWIFVFEELHHALLRDAEIYAEVVGYGASCDAYHASRPHPSGTASAEAIRMALDDANLAPEEVDHFSAYGNSTKINDSYETKIIKMVFGNHAYKLTVSSIKSMFGHPIGASGASQVAAVALGFKHELIPPTINYEFPDPACDLDYVPNKPRNGTSKVALCNSLSFGGKNASLVLRRYTPDLC